MRSIVDGFIELKSDLPLIIRIYDGRIIIISRNVYIGYAIPIKIVGCDPVNLGIRNFFYHTSIIKIPGSLSCAVPDVHVNRTCTGEDFLLKISQKGCSVADEVIIKDT